MVKGDLRLFRICLQTILEFGLIYNSDDQMQVKVEVTGLTEDQLFLTQFQVQLSESSTYDY